MKLFLFVFTFLFAFACSTKEEPKSQTLELAIEQFNEAYRIGNTDVLSKMITDNYTHTNGSWKSFGKEQWMSYMIKRQERLTSGGLVIDQYVMDELAIVFFENSAIVTARISTSGVEHNQPFSKQFRVTNIWVSQEGKWLRAGFHDSAIQ